MQRLAHILPQYASACVVLFTGWRPVDVARLVWSPSLVEDGDVLDVAYAYSKSSRLRAARGRAVNDARPLGCSGQSLCAHCAVRAYARATAAVTRAAMRDLASALPPGSAPVRPLFLSHDGRNTGIGSSVVTRRLTPLVQELGIPGATVYTLRALVASAMHMHGFSLDSLCEWFGWTSARTFTSFYHVVRALPIPRTDRPRWDAFPAVLLRAVDGQV